ncbi:hypothetical protein Tco_1477202 [Tanacetum coccineum]
MATSLLSRHNIGFKTPRPRLTTWIASNVDVPRTYPRQIGMRKLPFGMIPRTWPGVLKITKNRAKCTVVCRQGSRSLAALRDQMGNDEDEVIDLTGPEWDQAGQVLLDLNVKVLYEHSETPIKILSSDMLNKLEEGVFPKDDGGDTDVVSDKERVSEEDDVDEDYCSMGVPTNLEELRDQLFVVRNGTLPLLVLLFLNYMLHENNPSYEKIVQADNMIMQLGCNTTNNFVDCGVFMMHHMENFKGNGDSCNLSREGKEQNKELKNLCQKYAAKILLADYNWVKKEFEHETPLKERQQLEDDALKTIKARVKQMMK